MSRILFISYASNQHSGVGNRVYYLSRELAKKGHEVHVITKQGEYVSKEVNAYYVQIPKHILKIPPVPLPQVSIFSFCKEVKASWIDLANVGFCLKK